MIDQAAQRLAQAEANLITANEVHEAAIAHREQILGRLRDIESRRQGIRSDLSTGKLTPKEAGALLASLDEDREDLRALLGEAEQAITASPLRQAREAHDFAAAELRRAYDEAALLALQRHIADIERTLTCALAELSQLGIKLGRPRALSSVWRPTDDLNRAVHYNVAPSV